MGQLLKHIIGDRKVAGENAIALFGSMPPPVGKVWELYGQYVDVHLE